MYTSVAEFVQDWTRESGISLKVHRALSDASLSTKADAEANSLGQIAWHMVVMIGLTGAQLGLEVKAPARGTPTPARAAEIADAYETAARSLAELAGSLIEDARLGKEVSYFGRTLPTAAVLQSLVRHQVHHRGQMTILMRLAGAVPPGVYGPSREEAAALRARPGAP